MRLAFIGWRRGYYKATGPVIDAALRRKHTVTVLVRYDKKPGEAVPFGQFVPYEQRLPWWQVGEAIDPGDHSFDAVIGPNLHTHDTTRWMNLRCDRTGPARFYSLDHMWDQANALPDPRMTQCFSSAYQRELSQGIRGPVTGLTTLDAFGIIDPQAVRAKYFTDRAGITPNPILLLFAPKFRGVGWRQGLGRYLHFRALIRDLRRWCDERRWLLVVKTRVKHGVPGITFQYAHRVFCDRGYWPHTSAELTAIASLVVHYQSGACLEAAIANVPQYSVFLPQPHLMEYRTSREAYGGHQYTISRWPRVLERLDRVEHMEPFVVDPRERERYVSRYLGPSGDFKSSERVMDLVEADAQ